MQKSYCKVEVEFDQAVSLEKNARSWKKKLRKRDAQTAIANLEQTIKVEENKDVIIPANPSQSDDSAMTSAPSANTAAGSQAQSPSTGQSSSSGKTAASAPGKTDSSQNSSDQAVLPRLVPPARPQARFLLRLRGAWKFRGGCIRDQNCHRSLQSSFG